MTQANFARPKGARDKKPRKRRRKTRIESRINRKVESIKDQFRPEPTKLEKTIKYIKENPIKSLATAGGVGLLGVTQGARLARNLEKIVGLDLRTAAKKRYDRARQARIVYRSKRNAKYNDLEEITMFKDAEFARPKGAKDKKPRKRRRKKIYNKKNKEGVSTETKENLAKAQAFRARLMPLIYGVKEARGLARMVGFTSEFANAYQGDMPLVMDMEGKQIRGRGGIVKLISDAIKGHAVEYNPKEYDSRNRYYERYATLLSDSHGRLSRSKDVGGKPDINKSQVYGQQGISAEKGKVGGSMLTRQYSNKYNEANFESNMIEKYKKRFKSFGKKAKAFGDKQMKKAREKVKDAKIRAKLGKMALKGAYHTGRYSEKGSRLKKRLLGN